MKRIGLADHVIVVLSDKYLRSLNSALPSPENVRLDVPAK
jgi:hypothetical protein